MLHWTHVQMSGGCRGGLGAGALPLADGRLETLADELRGLITVRTSYGYRIDHEATKHDDRAVAIGMACVKILERAPHRRFVKPEIVEKSAPEPLKSRRISAEGRGLYGMGNGKVHY